MNEAEFAERIRRHLDAGLKTIDAGTAARLARARDAAVASAAPARDFVPATGGYFGPMMAAGHWPRSLLAAVVVAALVAFAVKWQAGDLVADLSEVDSALLVDDLPVDVLLDKGFEAWLADSH